MDRLKLSMGEAAVDEHGKGFRRVHELLEVIQSLPHLMDRRRYESSRRQRTSCRTNVVLACSELAGSSMTATGVPEQAFVNLADQAETQREFREPLKPVAHRRD